MTHDSNNSNAKAATAANLAKLEDMIREAAPDLNPNTVAPMSKDMHSLGIATLDKVTAFIAKHRVANGEVYGFNSAKIVNGSGTLPTNTPPKPKQEFVGGPFFEALHTGQLPQSGLPRVNIGIGANREAQLKQALHKANAESIRTWEANRQKK